MKRLRSKKRESDLLPVTVEVQIRSACQACWVYSWDRERTQLRVQGVEPGQHHLPADLAVLSLDLQQEVPVYVLASWSIAPGTVLPVRVLGGFQISPPGACEVEAFPLAQCVLLATPDLPDLPLLCEKLEHVPHALLTAIQVHARMQVPGDSLVEAQPVIYTAAEIAHRLREARFWLRRMRRLAGHSEHRQAQAVAWRVGEELTDEQRRQIALAHSSQSLASLLQAEQLIHAVPARFQKALERLLLHNEHLLAFLERPLLLRRTGWLGLQQYRANAGLFLLTDTQVLWLRDFFSPGSAAYPEGYIARSLPLERLAGIRLLSKSEDAPERIATFLQLHIRSESRGGCEDLEIIFPHDEQSQGALARIVPLIQAFVPQDALSERRVRCLPVVEPWIPHGEEARKLSSLQRVLPEAQRDRLEQRLAESLQVTGEELLASAPVPALEQYRSPARLVALTRAAVLLVEISAASAHRELSFRQTPTLQVQRYELACISSVQLSYSLFGSDLRLYLPQADGTTRECVIPFHSPAATWFLPLFTRLRLALRTPLP
jgi:hypothetical protein